MLPKLLYFTLFLFVFTIFSGCASMNQTSHVTGVPLPAEQAKKIRELGQAAKTIPDDRQDHYAGILYKLIQESPDPLIRREAVIAVGNYRSQVVVQALKHASSDSDRDVRQAVCQAWVQYNGEESVPQLIEILATESDIDIRMDAIEMLGTMKDKRAVTAMIAPLSTPDPALQHYTMKALQKITGYNSDDPHQWLAYCKGEIERPQEQMAWYRR